MSSRAPVICTYMGRNSARREKLFRFILHRSWATAANVYPVPYPKPVLAQALEGNAELAREMWEVLESILPATLLGEDQVYGGGLYKMEPNELANVPVDAIAAPLTAPGDRPGKQCEMFWDEAT